MSWSISKAGKAGEVRQEVEKAMADITYLTGKEKDVKEAAGLMLDEALAGTDPEREVSVSASGHADINGDSVKQVLNISIQ